MRGGLRVGQGRKPRALLDKLPDNPGKRPLKVMDLPEGADLNGEDMPEPKAYMKEKQRNGGKLEATKNSPWDVDLSVRAYAGQHRGIGGNLFVGYHF